MTDAKREWEGVVLIPFIDQKRLIEADRILRSVAALTGESHNKKKKKKKAIETVTVTHTETEIEIVT
jgi:5'-3' exonuclease